MSVNLSKMTTTNSMKAAMKRWIPGVDLSVTVDRTSDDLNPQNEVGGGGATNFLFGARSRYGRAVRFNNRLLF